MTIPTPQHPFKSRSFFHSLGFALNGIQSVFRTERNFQTHVVLGILVVVAACFFQVTYWEWALLILCMCVMMAVEALNTAIEYLVDMLLDGMYNEQGKLVKDIAAGACLITATGVGIAGLCIFSPHVWTLIFH